MNDQRPPAFNYQPQDWQERAACLWADLNMFYPPAEHLAGTNPLDSPHIVAAKALCATCPVRVECLDYALRIDDKWGIYGGMTSGERRRMVRHVG